MSLVIDKSLTGVELAPGFAINEILQSVSLAQSRWSGLLTTSEPSMAVPSAMVETSPKGSSLGSRSAFSRAMYRSSPIDGSCKSQLSANWTNSSNPLSLTSSRVSGHIDDGIAAVNNIIVSEGIRCASDRDVIA